MERPVDARPPTLRERIDLMDRELDRTRDLICKIHEELMHLCQRVVKLEVECGLVPEEPVPEEPVPFRWQLLNIGRSSQE